MLAEEAFRTLGISSQAEMDATIRKAEQAYDLIYELYLIGKATTEDLNRADEALARAKGSRSTSTSGGGGGGGSQTRQPLLQVSTVVTDLSRGLTDLIFKGGKFGEVMKNVGVEIGKSLVRNVLEAGLMKIGKYLADLASKAVPALGRALGGIFGGGASAAGGATGGIGGTGGGAGGAMGAVSSGISGVVSAVSGVVTAAASVVQAFQLAGIGKDTGRMEESLRGILNVLALNGAESIHSFAKATQFATLGLRDYWITTGHTMLVKMSSSLDVLVAKASVPAVAATGGAPINITIQGGIYSADPASMDRFVDEIARRIRERTGYRP
jgi:hypothetical protein